MLLRISWVLGVISLAVAGGCSGGAADAPTTVPVTVTITLDDKPLSNANVSFAPATQEGKFGAAFGLTDSAGIATLSYRGTMSGAPPGPYRVAVSKLVDRNGADVTPDENTPPIDLEALGVKELLPAAYSSAELTKLTAVVGATGAELNFPLKSKP